MCGIGGRTIAEAKRNISWIEASRWKAYIDKRGTLNAGLRNEALIATVSMLIAGAARLKKEDGSGFTIADFMPHIAETKEQELTPEKAFETLMKVHRRG